MGSLPGRWGAGLWSSRTASRSLHGLRGSARVGKISTAWSFSSRTPSGGPLPSRRLLPVRHTHCIPLHACRAPATATWLPSNAPQGEPDDPAPTLQVRGAGDRLRPRADRAGRLLRPAPRGAPGAAGERRRAVPGRLGGPWSMRSLLEAGLEFAFYDQHHLQPQGRTRSRKAPWSTCAEGADVIVGLGGGSSMDAAKGIAILVSNGGTDPGLRGLRQDPPPAAAAGAVPHHLRHRLGRIPVRHRHRHRTPLQNDHHEPHGGPGHQPHRPGHPGDPPRRVCHRHGVRRVEPRRGGVLLGGFHDPHGRARGQGDAPALSQPGRRR